MARAQGPNGGICSQTGLALLGSSRANEVVSVEFDEPAPSSLATVYASIHARDPFGLVRLNLYAQAGGHRGLIASAFVPSGWDGPCIVATGICAESWHVDAQGFSDVTLSVSLAARVCCSAFSVAVPPALLNRSSMPQDTQNLLALGPMPWTPDRGFYQALAGASGAPTVPDGSRVLRLWAHAAGAGASIAVSGGFSAFTLPVPPAAAGVEVLPGGNLVGPVMVTFTATDAYLVELVR